MTEGAKYIIPQYCGRTPPSVVLLRKRRNRVYRAGRDHHLFNGDRITSAALMERAGA